MRRATGITLQPHQILRLPRKMNLMIDRRRIWNVIYNAQSNRHHPPSSPNTAPATQNESHDWSISHMKRHLQCAEQQASPLQPHQILHLPRKMNPMIDPHHIWNVIYNARSKRHHPPTSPNTAPATPNESHDWSASHMKRHLQCGEQQASTSDLTKYCACHAKWMSWLSHITYEASFTMRGATGINLQPHQILRLPRKMTTQHFTEIGWKQVKRHFQCATDPTMIRERSENDPTMIRPRKRKTEPAAPPRLLFALARSRFYRKLQRFPLRLSFQISPNAAPATKSDTWTSPNAAPATKSDTWTSPNAAPAAKNDTWTSPNAAPATKSDTWTSPNAAPAAKNDTWTSPNAAPATKNDTWTSPNAAPATKTNTLTSPDYYYCYYYYYCCCCCCYCYCYYYYYYYYYY